MYAFIKSFLPTKENERKQQENMDSLNETVQESKQEVQTVEQMEWDISLGINQTSGKLNQLEAERDKVFKTIELIDNQLKLLSGANLSEEQTLEKQKLVRILEERVRPSVEIFDRQIDLLTRKLLVLHHKRDLLTQKKVSVEDATEDASRIQPQPPQDQTEGDGVQMDTITSNDYKEKKIENDNNSNNNPDSNV